MTYAIDNEKNCKINMLKEFTPVCDQLFEVFPELMMNSIDNLLDYGETEFNSWNEVKDNLESIKVFILINLFKQMF